MKKYYVIRLAFDDGFWNEEKQDFVGWLNATKYGLFEEPLFSDKYDFPFKSELLAASSKKPVTIVEVYEN